MGRKNWLFSDTPKGAQASAVIYSLIETAKANRVEPKCYLKFLLDTLPDLNFAQHPEKLELVMPWNEDVFQDADD